MARRTVDENGEYLPPEVPYPDPELPPNPPPAPEPGSSQRLADVMEARFRWAEALDYWQIANLESAAQRFANAEVAYEESQKAVVRYFQKFYSSSALELEFEMAEQASTSEKVAAVVATLFKAK